MHPIGGFALGALQLGLGIRNLREAWRETGRRTRLAGAPEVTGRGPDGTPMRYEIHRVRSLEDRIRYIREMAVKGVNDPYVRAWTVQVLSRRCGEKFCVREKDWEAEVDAVFHALRDRVRYTRDRVDKDTYQHPRRTLQLRGGDCFEAGTQVLTDDHRLVPVEDLRAGARILGLDRWSTVLDIWPKGLLTFDAIRLSTGACFRLTPDHHVYVLRCDEHPDAPGGDEPRPCPCPSDRRREERITVADLRLGDVLPRPTRTDVGFNVRERGLPFVAGIERGERSADAFDLTTDDHRVYLPEADVTVSQCDDYLITLGATLGSVGYEVRGDVLHTRGNDDWNHILARVGLPPDRPTRWKPLDASMDKPPGWYPPRSIIIRHRVFDIVRAGR